MIFVRKVSIKSLSEINRSTINKFYRTREFQRICLNCSAFQTDSNLHLSHVVRQTPPHNKRIIFPTITTEHTHILSTANLSGQIPQIR